MSQTRPSARNIEGSGPPKRQRNGWAIVGSVLLLVLVVFFVLRLRWPANTRPDEAGVAVASATTVATAVESNTITQTETAPANQSVAAAVSPLGQPAVVSVGKPYTAESPLALPAQSAQVVDTTSADTPVATPVQLPRYTYEIVNTYPHDPTAFTQGLVFDGDVLYEGTGLNGRSSLREVDLVSGKVLRQVDLDQVFFGEGITVWDEEIVQLTWQSEQGFVYDKTNFALQQTFSYPTEGWGITQDGRRLIMSDGSATLYFWDPATYQPVDEVDVYDLDGPVERLNELEYVNGEVFANVWQTNLIARIDPVSGQVLGWIDLTGLLAPEDSAGADVLNGIAYQSASDRLFVTGKLWPKLFEIRLLPMAQ